MTCNKRVFVAAIAALALIAGGCGDSSSDGRGTEGGSGGNGGSSGSGGSGGSSGSGGSGGADAGVDSGMPESHSCESGDMCDFACTSSDCTVECLDSRCTAECPEGGCTLDGDVGAIAGFTCEGGDCSTDCDGVSECTVDCAGGGCEVTCDGESTCKVLCGESGDPCAVTCEAGATAVCESGECEFTGCEPCDPTDIDEDYMPSVDPADYSTTIDNELFPLPVGAKWVYDSPDETTNIEVLEETYTVAAGVECVVVHDQVTDKEGVLIEDTLDYYAQDGDGNVWYFGEETAEYVNGKQVNTHGAWETGVDGALPGVIAWAMTPDIGTQYKEEYYRCYAEDMGEIVATGESVTVPTGKDGADVTYDDCLRIRDYSPLEPAANEHKLFCPGVGVAVVEEVPQGEASGEPVETLVKVSGL